MNINLKQTQKAVIWLCLAHLVCDIYTGFLNPIMPFIAENLGFSLAIATVIISIAHICSSMIQPIFGFFADNILKRFFIFWGLILVSVFIPLAPNAPNIQLLVIFMILGSLGGSFFHPQSIGFVNRFSANRCSSNMGTFISMGSVGFAIGPLIATFIVQRMGLQIITWTSMCGLILAFTMFFFVPKLSVLEVKPKHKNFLKSFRDIICCAEMKYLMLIAMMKSLVTNSCCILLPFLWKDFGHTPFYIGTGIFLFIFAGAIGSFVSPKLERMFGAKPVIYFSMCATFPMLMLFSFIYKTHPYVSALIFSMVGFTTMLAQPVIMVWAQKILPDYKSIVAGFINGFCWGFVALCLSLIGGLGEKIGIMPLLVILSIIPVFSSYFVRFLKEK